MTDKLTPAEQAAHIIAPWLAPGVSPEVAVADLQACGLLAGGDIVRTAAELDALPPGSFVIDTRGVGRQKNDYGVRHNAGLWTSAGRGGLTARELADGHPMWVAHRGRNVPVFLAVATRHVPVTGDETP